MPENFKKFYTMKAVFKVISGKMFHPRNPVNNGGTQNGSAYWKVHLSTEPTQPTELFSVLLTYTGYRAYTVKPCLHFLTKEKLIYFLFYWPTCSLRSLCSNSSELRPVQNVAVPKSVFKFQFQFIWFQGILLTFLPKKVNNQDQSIYFG